ncbi:protein phosphatase 2C domain-containing protein [Pengzhenrongella sicca]|uniref:Protein phosphatase 2C domain-containing protein n=1 Tax=Pengzhenrongella sicca TaxID=2819238 RepID=A0A8A4ZH88_9MICO|nr:protein phosphatase 2C domain-containing protein [Pengzhenrongella sicca]
MTCAECGAAAPADARFCEACGHEFPQVAAPAAAARAESSAASSAVDAAAAAAPDGPIPCAECGGVVDPDGYCSLCGAKAPVPRDHLVEQPQPWVGAVSDRGVRHRRNEDAMATAADEAPGGRAILVVCDGVSSSENSDVASLAAARAAREVLVHSRAQGLGTDSTLLAVLSDRIEAAADAASRAVAQSTAADHGASPPSCTFVAAVVERDRIVAGVVGDSRAYWFPDGGEPLALTVDDSWSAEQMALGVPRAEAESGPHAHAITRWLGVDAPDHTPRITTAAVTSPGWLLVCSDGLWNYCSAADDLEALLRRTAADAAGEPLATASALVDWANAQGGHDNITVALARLGTAAPDRQGTATSGES